jgi:hypothetical protein
MGAPTDTPLVAVHTVILYQPACHDCGWSGQLWEQLPHADAEADSHDCWARWRGSD